MRRKPKINKHAKHRRAQFHARKHREELQRMRHPKPVSKDGSILTPKRLAVKKRESYD